MVLRIEESRGLGVDQSLAVTRFGLIVVPDRSVIFQRTRPGTAHQDRVETDAAGTVVDVEGKGTGLVDSEAASVVVFDGVGSHSRDGLLDRAPPSHPAFQTFLCSPVVTVGRLHESKEWGCQTP